MPINYLAILVASVVAFIIGMLWYSPLLFGKLWMRLSGIKGPPKKDGMGKTMLLAFVSTLVTAYILSYFINILRYSTASDGAILGFMIWIGFLATSLLGSVLWEGKSYSLYFLNATHHLLNLVVMGAIIGAWN